MNRVSFSEMCLDTVQSVIDLANEGRSMYAHNCALVAVMPVLTGAMTMDEVLENPDRAEALGAKEMLSRVDEKHYRSLCQHFMSRPEEDQP